MHTVLDTNIVVSALLFRDPSTAVYHAIREGRLVPLISPPMFREYARVLAYPKFGLNDSEVIYLLEEEIGRYFKPLQGPLTDRSWIPEDPSDDCFINTALASPGSILVSGDRHILDAREGLPVPVYTLAELLEKLY
jgi:putative PIN family toxin of toxin-antitoxin system